LFQHIESTADIITKMWLVMAQLNYIPLSLVFDIVKKIDVKKITSKNRYRLNSMIIISLFLSVCHTDSQVTKNHQDYLSPFHVFYVYNIKINDI